MRSGLLILGYLLITGLVSCEKQEIDRFTVGYTVTSGWIDYLYSVKLDQDGVMQVISRSGLGISQRENSYQVDGPDMDDLKKELKTLTSINIDDRYGFGDNKPYDLPLNKYRYEIGTRSDSTTLYFPEENELPEELDAFISVLSRIISETDTLRAAGR